MKLDAEKGERKCKEEREKLEHVIVDKKVQECISGEEREELYYVVVDRERGNDRSKARNKTRRGDSETSGGVHMDIQKVGVWNSDNVEII